MSDEEDPAEWVDTIFYYAPELAVLLVPPGVADDDGQAGGEEGEHEEELLGGPALAVQDDRAGAHAQIKPELAPHWHFQYKQLDIDYVWNREYLDLFICDIAQLATPLLSMGS